MLYEYERRNTIIHNLHPAVKITLLFNTIILLIFWWDLRLVAPLMVFSILISKLAKWPYGWLKSLIPFFALMLILLVSYALFMSPRAVGILGETGRKALITLVDPKSNPLGNFAIGITVGSLYWLSSIGMRIITLVFAALTFTYSTAPAEVSEVLKTYRFPLVFIFFVMAVLRFAPIIIRRYKQIKNAQKLRGWEIKSKNPKHVLSEMLPLIYPLLTYFTQLNKRLSISATSRALGATARPGEWAERIKLSIKEKLFMISYFSICIIALILFFLFGIGRIA